MTAGEQWTSEQLRALRSAHFRPRAWVWFVAASLQRAGDTRRASPGLARQARAWAAACLLAQLAAAAAVRRAGASAPRRRALIAWWAATAAMLDWHLGMLEGPAGEQRDRLGAANAVTLARVGLVPFVSATTCGSGRDRAAFSTLIAAAALTDTLDGQLARRRGTTRLGRDLDTIADVLVKLAAARTARRAGWLTPAGARLLTACQGAGVALATASCFATGRRQAAPTGEVRWSAPALFGGLALAPRAPRLGSALVTGGALVTAIATTRRAGEGTREHDRYGMASSRQVRRPSTAHRLTDADPVVASFPEVNAIVEGLGVELAADRSRPARHMRQATSPS
jgi:phosphatidylglycerophosphate synthase